MNEDSHSRNREMERVIEEESIGLDNLVLAKGEGRN